jgi:hypothetical protein
MSIKNSAGRLTYAQLIAVPAGNKNQGFMQETGGEI